MPESEGHLVRNERKTAAAATATTTQTYKHVCVVVAVAVLSYMSAVFIQDWGDEDGCGFVCELGVCRVSKCT